MNDKIFQDKIFEIATKIREWADARNLIKGSDSKTQTLKTVSEFGELAKAIGKIDKPEIIDGIGDVLVTQIIVCEQIGVNFENVVNRAFNMPFKIEGTPLMILANATDVIGGMADNITKGQADHFAENMAKFFCYLRCFAVIYATSIEESMGHAYDEIKDRRGVMYHGVFIKSTDPRYTSALAELGLPADA